MRSFSIGISFSDQELARIAETQQITEKELSKESIEDWVIYLINRELAVLEELNYEKVT